MTQVTLTGQYCLDNVKLPNRYADLVFTDDGTTLHAPADFSEQLDKLFGSSDWDCFEVLARRDNGRWVQVRDYSQADEIIQLDREVA